MVTIYDVAKRAGVSPATVSRVFSGHANVAQARADAVHEAARELDFVPNRNARRLRTNSSEIIAMMVPDIENPFFTLMTRAVEDVAREAGFSVMLCNTNEDPVREHEYMRVAVSEPVAGVILVPSPGTNLDLALERSVPVVCADRHALGYEVDTVVADNKDSSASATRLLYDAGYERIACVTGPDGVETADMRMAGWALAVQEHTGAPPDPCLGIRAAYTVEDGERAVRLLMDLPQPPDAIFAANNRLGAAALRVLNERGLLPPTVGVVSFGGLPLILLAPLGVLITHLPARELGHQAARMLLERINGLAAPARSVTLPVVVGGEGSGIDMIYKAQGSAE
ncbi:MAG: LacI family transcriptional regulator [Propionibacteriaceae bacterium]|jgi:LacI family transcriptional regulator|nr:LacI family transcriptional regulator [Propionibacteriaceae bacterium]